MEPFTNRFHSFESMRFVPISMKILLSFYFCMSPIQLSIKSNSTENTLSVLQSVMGIPDVRVFTLSYRIDSNNKLQGK